MWRKNMCKEKGYAEEKCMQKKKIYGNELSIREELYQIMS